MRFILQDSRKSLLKRPAGAGSPIKPLDAGGIHSVLSLQVVLDATEEFDASSGDPLYNRRVQTFDFLGMVGAYDAARAAAPGLTSWEVTNALLTFHLGGADDAAVGGDLAYWYGRNRTLQGISVASAQQVIGAAGFGSAARGTDREGSDVDLLVDLDERATLFTLAGLEQALNELLGVSVDVRTPAEISRYIRDRVLAEARPL